MARFCAMSNPPESVDRLAWFAGDQDALDLYQRLAYVAHAWDDLIDQDKAVNVNKLMANLLLYLPQNPCYRRFEVEIRTLMIPSIVSYQAANLMEKSGDAHKLEVAHYLRYAVMQVGVFLMGVTNGIDRAAELLADAATVMVPERLDDFLKEHTKC